LLALLLQEDIRKDMGWNNVKGLIIKATQINQGSYVPHNEIFKEMRVFY
jgi:hypothetical protein